MLWEIIFCHTCIVKALHISPQHLSRQRKVKRNRFQKPVVRMTKDEVDREKLNPFVQMPEGIETSVCGGLVFLMTTLLMCTPMRSMACLEEYQIMQK